MFHQSHQQTFVPQINQLQTTATMKSSPATTHAGQKNVTQIVLIGNDNISLGAYQSLVRNLQTGIRDGNVQLTIISGEQFYTCYGLMQECISGMIDYNNLLVPMKTCFSQAKHISGSVIGIDSSKRSITVSQQDGQLTTIAYDHLVVGNEHFTSTLQSDKTHTGFTIQSAVDMLKTRRQLDHLMHQAALARDKFSAARILRVAVAGEGMEAVELAASIAECLKQLSAQYSLKGIKATLYLVLNQPALSSATAKPDKITKYIKDELQNCGVRIFYNKHVIRVNADGAVLQDGSFINCSIVYSTGKSTCEVPCASNAFGTATKKASLPTDNYGRVTAYKNAWSEKVRERMLLPQASQYMRLLQEGRIVGENIAAYLKQRPLTSIQNVSTMAGSIGKGKGFASVFGLQLTGWLAFYVRIIWLLVLIPSVNRSACIKNYLAFYTNKQKAKKTFRPILTIAERKLTFQKLAF